MRKISNIGDKELQNEEINTLAAFILETKDFSLARALINTLMTKSERVVISQRLAILRMVKKEFKYHEIERKLKTTPTTISKAIANYEKDASYMKLFDAAMEKFRFKPKKYVEKIDSDYPNRGKIQGLVCGVRQFLRDQKYEKSKRKRVKKD